jgi:hydroxymethylpyrimidine kinase / phosphomethylpyrimidine kinase / thiamine-phosphate diphosphorylase
MNQQHDIIVDLVEAEKRVGYALKSCLAIEKGARLILADGAQSVVINHIYLEGSDFNQDYWTDGAQSFWISSQKDVMENNQGEKQVLSSLLMLALSLGYDIKDAIIIAKMCENKIIRTKMDEHLLTDSNWPEEEIDLPYLARDPLYQPPPQFKDCGREPLGLYPIVDSIHWLKKLLPLGVKTIQLRIKDKEGVALENEIKESVVLADNYGTRLFINDYWEAAIRYHAYGVHLGQEDLEYADIESIRKAGLRLGISTHCYYEVARAHALAPSYLACGPLYPTTSKILSCLPQGISKLKRWCRTLTYPLVAIGGITMERLPEVMSTGVNGIAMISLITQAADPIAMTEKLLHVFNAFQSR